jgi:hypothetical protein
MSSDQSGHSVAMNDAGDRVVIGAPLNDGNDGNEQDAGQVRIYEHTTLNGWNLLESDIDGENAGANCGFSVEWDDKTDTIFIPYRYHHLVTF